MVGLNCGAVLSPRAGIGISAAVAAAGAADVEAIFTWLTGGDLADDRMNDRFCGGFDNVNSDDVWEVSYVGDEGEVRDECGDKL